MFEDPELPDQLSLSLNEKYDDQNSPCREPHKAPASPDYNCETPEIHVIIKEEDEGWTVSENHENFGSEGGNECPSTHICHPHFKACGKDSSISYGVERRQRLCCLEKCSEESAGPTYCGQSSSASEGRPQRSPVDSDEKPVLSCLHGRASENAPARQRANAGETPVAARAALETSPRRTRSMRACERARAGGEGRRDGNGSAPPSAEAELHHAKRSAPYRSSHGRKTASASLGDRTLRLTVRLRAGEEEGEEGEEEEEDEAIGGLINSDGEVVEWDRQDSPDQDCENTDDPHPSKGVVLSQSRPRGQNQRDSGSPTLIMEVVSVGDDEERDEGEDKERVAKMPAASPLRRGKGHRRKSKEAAVAAAAVAAAAAASSDPPDAEEEAPAKPGKRRSRRKISDSRLPSKEAREAEPGMSRQTRRRRVFTPILEAEEQNSKSVRRAAAKRPCRKRRDVKPSAEVGESTERKRPGRKMIHVPLDIPPELLKTPKEKVDYHCSVCGKEFPHAYKLERHQLIHTGEKPYCCSICRRGFNQKGNLKTHYKVHFGRKGAADFDDEVNPIASELSEYLKSLPGESRIRSSHHCLECGKDCESQSALQAHHITTHGEGAAEPPAAADVAAATTKRGAMQLLLCRRCGVQFNDKEKLDEHMKSHIKEKPYSCPDCGKRFINESYIQIHQRLHTGEKPFLCSQCGRGFHTASSLKLHEMQHSGERPFACSICGKKFRINSYLTAHYQTHIKDRPFVCSVCGKGYSRAEELKVHHRLHTGERPYQCGECGKSFIYRQGLRQHQRTHAGRRIGPTRQLGRPKQQAQLDI